MMAAMVCLAALLAGMVPGGLSIHVEACSTILYALHRDWQATNEAVRRFGSASEGNPIIRASSADAYFTSLTLTVTAACRETFAWRLVALVVYAAESLAISTHERAGTSFGGPVVFFTIR